MTKARDIASMLSSTQTLANKTLASTTSFPSQYNFYVKMSANTTGNNSTWTVVPLNTLVWGTFDTTNYKFVVPKAGKWMFFYSVRFKDGAWGRFLALSLGGTILSGGASSTIARPGGHVSYGSASYNPNYFNMLRPQIDFDANHIEIVPNAYNLNTCN